jgi:YegS/Rv2252/BmrU family lipid kinase
MVRAVLIANPLAGGTVPRGVIRVRETFEGGGWSVEVGTIRGPGDARRLAAQARDAQSDVVVVYGGDGTAMQAAAELIGTDIPLGLIAGGTGNLLAGNLRLPQKHAAAAAALLRARPRRVDVGRVERDDGVHYFAVGAGAGFDAVMMRDTTGGAKRRWGMLAYVATGLRALGDVANAQHTVTVDGTTVEGPAATVLVANCPEIIPGVLRLGGPVRLDDGLFDIFIVRADSPTQAALAMFELCYDPQENGSRVLRLRGKEITIVARDARPVQLDGESAGETPVTATMVPGGLRVLVP